MNLENLGVQEMNIRECKKIDGGNNFEDGLAAGVGATTVEHSQSFWYWIGYGLGVELRTGGDL